MWQEKKPAYEEKNIIPTVKHGGSLMFWGCMSASGTGALHEVEGKINAGQYQQILKQPPTISQKAKNEEAVSLNKTMIQNTKQSQLRNGLKRMK